MRVLFLTHRLPYAPNRGDRIRAYHMLRFLSSQCAVELVSLVHDGEEGARVDALRELGVRASVAHVPRVANTVRAGLMLATTRPLTHVLLSAPQFVPTIDAIVQARPPDVVLTYCSGMAPFALMKPLAPAPFVLDMVDVDSAKWAALAARTRPPLRWIYEREADRLAQFEVRATRAAAATLVVNDRERQKLRRLTPDGDVRILENGIDTATFAPPGPPSSAPIVVFCGVLAYQPNADAVRWLARDVWPLVAARRPDARALIVGSASRAVMKQLSALHPAVEIVGPVPDVRPYLWRAAVSVAPLRVASGLQNKVLEAIAAGLPVIATSAVVDGLPPEASPACVRADCARAFADAILTRLAQTPAARRRVVEQADLRSLEWSRQLTPLSDILRRAVQPSMSIPA